MTSKIVLFVLIVTVYKVQSHTIYYPSSQTSTSSSNAKSSAGSPSSSSSTQASSNTQGTSSQSQSSSSQPSHSNQGIKASPQLQIVPGRKINLQAIPVSAVQGSVQQGQHQNIGYSIPRPPSQASASSQTQTSPAQLIQPYLPGPTSVITSPVSSITIPPSTTTTVFDHSLCNSLANALQMMIANEFINTAINNNIIKEGIDIPVVETVAPTFDLGAFLKGLNTQQIQQAPSLSETPVPDGSQYDWAAIQNFLNKQEEKPIVEATAAPSDVSDLMSYFQQYGQTAEQISQQQPSQSTQAVSTAGSQSPQAYPSQQSANDNVLEALAAYFGCNVSDICSSTNPSVPQFAFPEEIPAQLICNYGYMPTAVPVVSFSVQPLCGDDSNFVIGCKC